MPALGGGRRSAGQTGRGRRALSIPSGEGAERDSGGGSAAQTRSRRGFEVRLEVAGQVAADTNDELTLAFLRDAQFPGIFDVTVDTVARVGRGLFLDGSKVGAPVGAADAEDVFHDEHRRLAIVERTRGIRW